MQVFTQFIQRTLYHCACALNLRRSIRFVPLWICIRELSAATADFLTEGKLRRLNSDRRESSFGTLTAYSPVKRSLRIVLPVRPPRLSLMRGTGKFTVWTNLMQFAQQKSEGRPDDRSAIMSFYHNNIDRLWIVRDIHKNFIKQKKIIHFYTKVIPFLIKQ